MREAAALLNTHPSTVARRLDTLEALVGYRVVDRGSNGLSLTDAGSQLAPLAIEIEEKLWSLARNAAFLGDRQSQDIVIQATEGLGTHWISTLYAQQGGLNGAKINLICSDILPDLGRTMVDISVQYAPAANPDHVQRQLGYLQVLPFASKSYIEAFGLPKDQNDLRRFQIISQVGPHESADLWHMHFSPQEMQILEKSIALRTNSGSAQYYAIKGSMGIGGLPTYGILQDEDIVPIDVGVNQIIPIYAVYQKDRIRNRGAFRRALEWLQSIFDANEHPYFSNRLWLPQREGATVAEKQF